MRILILTAGFGEGHNTAARCIAEALRENPGVEVKVVDIYLETIPRFTKVLQAGYTIKERLLRPAMVAVAKKPE